jgi:N-acetylmuramoyl-L-alanine amidase|nr:MAG TPA: MurNAc-LAA [Caudoviricetes sp.]
MLVILDNGHGVNTPGKSSPDGRLREYKYTREIVARIHE